MKRHNNPIIWLVLAVFVVLAVLVDQAYIRHVLITACIFSTLAQFYNITYGFVGLYNFGFAAFFGIGAYTSAILATDLGVPVVVAMLLATVVSGIFGFVLMLPCLRMHGFTPGIVTLAFGEIARILISAAKFTKGEMGYWGIVPLFRSDTAYAVFAVLMAALTAVGISLLMKGRVGLAFRTICDDAQAAESIGNNIKAYKLLAMTVSCAGAGFVGAFYGHYLMTITPSICGLSYTTQILCMALFGGIGTIAGPAIGGIALTALTEMLRFLDDYRMLIYGLLLIVVIMFFPKGIMGVYDAAKKGIAAARKGGCGHGDAGD